MVTVLADRAQGAVLRLARPQAVGGPERLRSRGRDRRRVGVPRPVPVGRGRRRRRHAVGARRRPQSRRTSPAGPAASISSAPSTARASSTTTRRTRRCGSTTARISTRPSRSPTSRGRRPAHLDGLDQQLALRERGADRRLARRAVDPARAGAAAGSRRHAPGAVAGGGAQRAARQPAANPREQGVAALPASAEIEIEMRPGDWARRASGCRTARARRSPSASPPRRPRCSSTGASRERPPFHAEYPGRHAGPSRWRDGKVTLRVLFDRIVVEVFANDGETVVTERVYPTHRSIACSC